MDAVRYRHLKRGEEPELSRMILASFREFVGHEFSADGVAEFESYVSLGRLSEPRSRRKTLVATVDDQIVGVVRLGEGDGIDHINLLFVDKRFHRQGIAREFMRRLLALALRRNPRVNRFTVNSTRYAVPVYERLGFERTSDECIVGGIISIPMAITADPKR